MPVRRAVDLTFLCCPYADRGDLRPTAEDEIVCESCGRRFRVAGGRPVLFDEGRSIFSSEAVAATADVRQFPEDSGWRYQLRRMAPAAATREISLPLLEKHRALLPSGPAVLIIGCGSGAGRYA